MPAIMWPQMRRKVSKKRLSMTSLIDVIFLLLLFFMLSSTFSKYATVPLPLGTTGAPPETPPAFVKVGVDTITLNGQAITLTNLPAALAAPDRTAAILALGPGVSAQRLTDVLTALRNVENLSLNVLVPA